MSAGAVRLALLLAAGTLLAACAGPRKQLRRADRELADGEHLRAARLYDSVRRDHPDRDAAWTGAARSWLALHEGARALAAAEGAAERGAPEADLLRGAALVQVGRGDEARPLLSDVPADAPADELLGRLSLADAWLAAGDPTRAAAVLEPLATTSADAGALLAWAEWQGRGQAGCPGAADLAARAAADADAAEAPRPLTLATAVLDHCARPDDAAHFAERARIFQGDLADRLPAEADLRTAGGDAPGAARLLSMAAVLSPEDGRIHRELGVRWLAVERPALAAEALQTALPLPPYEQPLAAHAPIVGGDGMTRAERAAAAADLWQALARAHAALDDAPAATAARERALLARDTLEQDDPAAGPSTAAAWAELGLEWARLGRGDRAEAAARASLRLDDQGHLGWLAMAHAARAQRDPRTALGAARSAWERATGDPAVAEIYADAAIGLGEGDLARRVLETALSRLQGAPHPLAPRLRQLLDLVE